MDTKMDEAKMKEVFFASEELKAEFGNDFKAFAAFSKANLAGRIRLCVGKCSMMSAEEFIRSSELDRLGKEIEKKTAELERLKGLQTKSAEDEARQYDNASPCGQ